jgi:hypothetical protein
VGTSYTHSLTHTVHPILSPSRRIRIISPQRTFPTSKHARIQAPRPKGYPPSPYHSPPLAESVQKDQRSGDEMRRRSALRRIQSSPVLCFAVLEGDARHTYITQCTHACTHAPRHAHPPLHFSRVLFPSLSLCPLPNNPIPSHPLCLFLSLALPPTHPRSTPFAQTPYSVSGRLDGRPSSTVVLVLGLAASNNQTREIDRRAPSTSHRGKAARVARDSSLPLPSNLSRPYLILSARLHSVLLSFSPHTTAFILKSTIPKIPEQRNIHPIRIL